VRLFHHLWKLLAILVLACLKLHAPAFVLLVFNLYLIFIRKYYINFSITKTQTTTIAGITSTNYFCNDGGSCPPNTSTDTFTCCNTNSCNTVSTTGTLTCYFKAGSNAITLNGCTSCAVSLF
jgi:hypothetical protein